MRHMPSMVIRSRNPRCGAAATSSLRQPWQCTSVTDVPSSRSVTSRLRGQGVFASDLLTPMTRRLLLAMAVCGHCGQENPDGFRFCGSCGSPLAAHRAERGAEGRHRAVRRPRGLHQPQRADGRRGCPRHARSLPRPVARAARALRRDGREVHRRRRDGPVRRPDRPRGRSGTGGARGARDPGGDRPVERRRAGPRPARAGRGQHRRGADRAERRRRARRGDGVRRRGQHGRPAAGGRAGGRDPRRRDDIPRDRPGNHLPARRARRRQGESPSRCPRGRRRRRGPGSASTSSSGRRRRWSDAERSSISCSTPCAAAGRSGRCSSSPWWGSPASARAGSSGSCSRPSNAIRTSSPGVRADRSRMAMG